ncbi:hypothetical protein VIGAN_10201600, partial [Vigna angularis var. angularis]
VRSLSFTYNSQNPENAKKKKQTATLPEIASLLLHHRRTTHNRISLHRTTFTCRSRKARSVVTTKNFFSIDRNANPARNHFSESRHCFHVLPLPEILKPTRKAKNQK